MSPPPKALDPKVQGLVCAFSVYCTLQPVFEFGGRWCLSFLQDVQLSSDCRELVGDFVPGVACMRLRDLSYLCVLQSLISVFVVAHKILSLCA